MLKKLIQKGAKAVAKKNSGSEWDGLREAERVLKGNNAVTKWRNVEEAYGKLMIAIGKLPGTASDLGKDAVKNADVSSFLISLSPSCNDTHQSEYVLATTKSLLEKAHATYTKTERGGYIEHQDIYNHFKGKYPNAELLNKEPAESDTLTPEGTASAFNASKTLSMPEDKTISTTTGATPQPEALNKSGNPAMVFSAPKPAAENIQQQSPKNSELHLNAALKALIQEAASRDAIDLHQLHLLLAMQVDPQRKCGEDNKSAYDLAREKGWQDLFEITRGAPHQLESTSVFKPD